MSATAAAAQNYSAQAFISALVINAVLLAVQVGAFVILKQRLPRIYSPRAFLPPPDKRAVPPPPGPWRWLTALIFAPTNGVIHSTGLDAYMFLRFLKMLLWIFLVFTISTFLVLIPIDSVGVGNSQSGLNKFTWGNISASKDQARFAAHIVLLYLLTFFVLFMIRREMLHFVHIRQQFLISKSHSRLAQARTVLITSVPDELADEDRMRLFTTFVPGGIDRVWLFRDTKRLNEVFTERQKACSKLEDALSKLLSRATETWNVKHAKKLKKIHFSDEEKQEIVNAPPKSPHDHLRELVPDDERPSHRTGFLGVFGDKVDSIEYYSREVSRLNTAIAEVRDTIVEGKFLGSAFVRCNLQMGAHVLAQCVSYHEPFKMYDKWLEAHPKDIVWSNLDESAVESRERSVISWVVTVGLILLWVFPVAFVGALSNITSLCAKVAWLRWICNAPTPIPGIIEGVLPPILLAILFSLIPVIFRVLSWYECTPRYSLISINVYRRYFVFLLIHGFLIVTLTSGITAAFVDILRTPTSTIQALASRLPGASTFFLTYMVSQGLAGAGGALIQLGTLILYFIRKWFLGRTPRQAYSVTFRMPSTDFGTVLPMLSLLTAITFAYSIISPIINLLALISFACIYVAWKFLIMQVFDQPPEHETGGLYFPLTVTGLFVGLYIEQICLACLFLLKISLARISSIVEAVLVVVLLVITVSAHIIIRASFNPITNYLPMSLATQKMAKRYERERQRHVCTEVSIKRSNLSPVKSIRRRVAAIPHKIHDDISGMIPFSGKHELKAVSESSGRADSPDHRSNRPQDDGLDQFRHSLSVPGDNEHSDIDRPVNTHQENRDGEVSDATRNIPDASETSNQAGYSKSRDSSSSRVKRQPPLDISRIGDVEPDGEESSEDEADRDEHAFDHPSTYKEQPCIWIPRDTLGLSTVLVDDLKEMGIKASDEGAVMDKRGIVEASRGPPDEEWDRGEGQADLHPGQD